METGNNNLNSEAKAYFLQQGQSINKLNDILDSNILSHYLGKWFSIILEIALYILFIVILVSVFQIPNRIPIDDKNELYNKDFADIIFLIQVICSILSLPILLFANLLGRNRKKNTLIRKAYEESALMKERFDLASKSLNL